MKERKFDYGKFYIYLYPRILFYGTCTSPRKPAVPIRWDLRSKGQVICACLYRVSAGQRRSMHSVFSVDNAFWAWRLLWYVEVPFETLKRLSCSKHKAKSVTFRCLRSIVSGGCMSDGVELKIRLGLLFSIYWVFTVWHFSSVVLHGNWWV